MRVLVTGANGHIGCNLVRELRARQHEVVPMVRETSDLQGLQPLGLTCAIGDVRDAAAVSKASEGCDAIIHLAAVYAFGGSVEQIVEPAMQGIDNVLRAAKAQGIRRVVHTSSVMAVGVSSKPTPLDESSWHDGAADPYAVAKTRSERRAHELAGELDLELVSLNPAGIIGRHDYRVTPSSGFLLAAANGAGAIYKGGVNYVDVRDVAWIHAEALTRGTPGERHLLTSDNVTVAEGIAHVSARTGARASTVPLPRSAMRGLARVVEAGFGLLGKDSPLQSSVVDEFYGRWSWYDNSKAREAFDWTPRPLTAVYDEGLHWLLHRGLLAESPAGRVREALGEPPDYH